MIRRSDVVRLRSGGPKMTVVSDNSSPMSFVACAWFDASSTLHRGEFPEECLVEVTDDDDRAPPVRVPTFPKL